MGWKPLPGREPQRFVRVGDRLDQVLRRLGAPSGDALTAVFERWPALVGERVAAHAEPVGIAEGRLAIRVDDAAWASQIRWLEPQIVEHLGTVLGAGSVTALDIRVGSARPARRGPVRGRRPR